MTPLCARRVVSPQTRLFCTWKTVCYVCRGTSYCNVMKDEDETETIMVVCTGEECSICCFLRQGSVCYICFVGALALQEVGVPRRVKVGDSSCDIIAYFAVKNSPSAAPPPPMYVAAAGSVGPDIPSVCRPRQAE